MAELKNVEGIFRLYRLKPSFTLAVSFGGRHFLFSSYRGIEQVILRIFVKKYDITHIINMGY